MSNLFELPEIDFVNTDPNETINNIITVYEAITGRKLFPADPVRLFLMSIGQIIIQQRVLLNDTAKQTLLRYARGDKLDHLGASAETPRLEATPATTTVRFHLSMPRTEVVLIPVGTRVSPGGDLYFLTASTVEIQPGNLSADVLCQCLTPGHVGNGFLPGQINILVDPLPWIDRVENLSESSGGTDREDDDRYRNRIHNSPERFSVAGPVGAYEYWARSAHKNISDVHVWSPAPTEVEIRVLMSGGEIPSSDILDEVFAVCNDRRIRPLTDRVTVLAPEIINYDINLTYWIDRANATEATTIQNSVQQAVDEYVAWQKSKIGRDIIPSELIRLVMNAGARRVNLVSPLYTEVDETQVAIADVINVSYGGLEND